MASKLMNLELQRREDLLNAALKEFVMQGFDNASTNVIAKDAGISKALMFHYVGSKQELFFLTYDYFSNLMRKEYFELMDYEEKDLFKRMRQSYLLQINLVKKYPCILELKKLEQTTIFHEKFEKDRKKRESVSTNCYEKIFSGIDMTNFREELNIEKSKEIILWANIGFTNKILNEVLADEKFDSPYSFNTEFILRRLDEYFEELKKLFYRKGSNIG